MMIIDAIESAASEHAVWFLVTAYLESLQRFHASLGVPLTAVTLPVRGVADLRGRLAALRACRDAPVASGTAHAELSEVLETAIDRLDAHLLCENR